MTNSEQQAILDGQLAAVRNRPIADCPFPAGGALGNAWRRGWYDIATLRGKAA